MPRPYGPSPPTSGNIPAAEASQSPLSSAVSPTPPAGAPGQFAPSKTEETIQSAITFSSQAAAPFTTKKKSNLFTLVLVVLLILGLGAVGYFFVYPKFFGNTEVVEAPAPPSEPVTPPEVPLVEEATPQFPTETSPLITESHKSLFKIPADATLELDVNTVELSSLRQAFDQSPAPVAVLKELVLKENNVFVKTAQLMALLLPSVFTSDVTSAFESDATIFEYQNDKGVWPGFVFKLNAQSDPASIKSKVAALESSQDIANFYLKNPGTAGAWKTGQTGNVQNRYTIFAGTGYALNYGWLGDKLIISTSYDGFKEALRRLQ
jgi:hypothetical protein